MKSLAIKENTWARLQRIKANILIQSLHSQIETKVTTDDALNFLIDLYEYQMNIENKSF